MKIPKDVDRQFFEDGVGKLSMMRLIAYHATRSGIWIMWLGVAILCAELFAFRTGTTAGLAVTAVGGGLIGVGEGAKAFQAGSERKG